MFESTKEKVGNCKVLTDSERNELANDIFNKKVDGYWIKVKGKIIATKKLGEMLKEVAGKENIVKDIEINHKYGVWGTVGTLRQYTPRKLKAKFGDI
jgi:hypothetical protein